MQRVTCKVINGHAFKLVPTEYKTQELCSRAADYDAYTILYMPKEHVSAEMYEKAVKQKPLFLEHVPEEYVSFELCETAVNGDVKAIKHVPEKYQDMLRQKYGIIHDITDKPKELCIKAFERNVDEIVNIPQEYISMEIAYKAVKTNGNHLGLVHEDNRSYNLCLTACKSPGEHTMNSVPAYYQTYEMWLAFAENMSDDMLKQIPKQYRTDEMIRKLFLRFPGVYSWISPQTKTDTIQLLKQCGSMLQYIPYNKRSKTFCKTALLHSNCPENVIKYVPKKYVCIKRKCNENTLCVNLFPKPKSAILQNPHIISVIPNVSIKLQELAVSLCGEVIFYIDDKTEKMCVDAVNQGVGLCSVPDKYKTRELCKTATTINVDSLRQTPDEYKDYEMYLHAFTLNPNVDYSKVYRQIHDYVIKIYYDTDSKQATPLDF